VRRALMQDRVIHERQILHLQQQLAQTLHALDYVRGSFGVPPSVAMPHLGESTTGFFDAAFQDVIRAN
jgi:hypothetical protein